MFGKAITVGNTGNYCVFSRWMQEMSNIDPYIFCTRFTCLETTKPFQQSPNILGTGIEQSQPHPTTGKGSICVHPSSTPNYHMVLQINFDLNEKPSEANFIWQKKNSIMEYFALLVNAKLKLRPSSKEQCNKYLPCFKLEIIVTKSLHGISVLILQQTDSSQTSVSPKSVAVFSPCSLDLVSSYPLEYF